MRRGILHLVPGLVFALGPRFGPFRDRFQCDHAGLRCRKRCNIDIFDQVYSFMTGHGRGDGCWPGQGGRKHV